MGLSRSGASLFFQMSVVGRSPPSCQRTYCSLMEIYRTRSVNKKLVNRNNTCGVAPVCRQQAMNTNISTGENGRSSREGPCRFVANSNGLRGGRVICLLFAERPGKRNTVRRPAVAVGTGSPAASGCRCPQTQNLPPECGRAQGSGARPRPKKL